MEELEGIVWEQVKRNLDELVPYEYNPRKISKKDLKLLRDNIKKVGYNARIMVDTDNTIIAGHQRWDALKQLGVKSAYVLVPPEKLTPEQFQQVNIQDNINNGEWEKDLLKDHFDRGDLIEWGMKEEDLFPEEMETVEGLTDDDAVPDEPLEPKSKLGDLYILGEHRLLCGDSCNIAEVERLMDGVKADMVYTDPPYGIDVKTDRAFSSPTRKCSGNSFPKIIGDDSIDSAINAFNICDELAPIICYWGGNYFAHKLPPSPFWLVWDKRVDEKQRDMNSDCELAYVKHPSKKSVRIFRHLWKGLFKDSENGIGLVHPTQKPIALAEFCIDELSPDSKTILDLFGGSGSTLIACEKLKRKCYMMELEPRYVDVIIKRWEDYTNKKAQLVSG